MQLPRLDQCSLGLEELVLRSESMQSVQSTVTRRDVLIWTGGAIVSMRLSPALATGITDIPAQTYFAGVKRALEALDKLGAPVAAADALQITALGAQNDAASVDASEKILDRYSLATLAVEADGSAHWVVGGTHRILIEQGWRLFLIRISNPAAHTDNLLISLGTGDVHGPGHMGGAGAARAYLPDSLSQAPRIEKMWLMSQVYETTPLIAFGQELATVPLSGIPVEYRVIQLFSRNSGRRSSKISAYALSTKPDRFRSLSHQELDFECLPSRTVTLGVLDVDGRGCVASLTIKDKQEQIYPPQSMRLAPDMFFQPQIYRADGETMRLPDGEYVVEAKRGPEYLVTSYNVIIDSSRTRIDVKLERWIDPAKWGWYSGDTHIHGAGCAHYEHPTEGVSPETMIRHVRGEGLSIGDVLSWGPSWYYQKQFFTGHSISPAATLEHPELQAANNASLDPHPTPEDRETLLRYDVEVSGFPSSHAGHLVLLRLKEQDYPGTKLIEDWPSWNLPILKWAKSQGAVGGMAHCGSGMVVESKELPNYDIPPMDGIGTQEAIVDVTHGVVDFLSGCDTQPLAELNAWYHMLNCGFRMALIGETDWPCVTGERVGVGRSYVRLEQRPVDDSGYDAWVRNLQKGKLYCGDGRSHFLEFKVNSRPSGDDDLTLHRASQVTVEALVAARLEPQLPERKQALKKEDWNSWHLENARIGSAREVSVELLVNGSAVEKARFIADGNPRPIRFKTFVSRSSWIALRILPSSHTHPVFVLVEGKPIRASRRSAKWCRACVDKIWEVKSPFMRESERPAAAEAFDHARATYDKITSECELA